MYQEIVVENKFKSISKNTKGLTSISAKALREKFGSTSHIYLDVEEKLESLWEEVRDEPSVKAKVDNWAKTIGTLYGYNPDLLVDRTYLSRRIGDGGAGSASVFLFI